MLRLFDRLIDFDRRLFARVTRRERETADTVLKELSNAANRSTLWLAIAMMLAILGGDRGRRAALRGAIAIALTSTLVNLPLKYLARRERPDLSDMARPLLIEMPNSFSFPSGHSASAAAFTTAVALEDPRRLPVVLPLAAGVAYSRVHLRVHYPLDVLAGLAIGTTIGFVSGPLTNGVRGWWQMHGPVAENLRPPTSDLILVLSPHAGSAKKLQRARRAMEREGLKVVAEIQVNKLNQLPRLLAEHDGAPPIVVAAGGDGTVGAVADALIGKDALMGVIPLGTSNDFARSIEIPIHPEAAVQLLARGPIRPVDAGRLTWGNGQPRHFVHAAATGVNVAFARFATRADLRERLGRLTYAVAAALALRERPVFSCEVDYGGRRERLNLVHLSVVNAPVFGGFLDLKMPTASPNDRMLHVLMIEHLPVRRLIRSALYPAIGWHRRIHGFRVAAVSRIAVQTPAEMDVTLDGELSGKLPGTFEVVPSALRVLAPMPGSPNVR